jgi:hypothetical protein
VAQERECYQALLGSAMSSIYKVIEIESLTMNVSKTFNVAVG